MVTKFIGLKELRQNMAGITREATKKRHRVIVLKKNSPLFELRPLSGADTILWTFQRELEEARESARKGDTYSTKEVRKMLGLKPYEI
ncbi:MAG: hypothetical protein AAB386_03720 [Patescibacteria group bacterium]